MRGMRKNEKWLWYANLGGTEGEYLRDDEGNVKTVTVNGLTVPIEVGGDTLYFNNPVRFLGHITPTGIETYAHGNENAALPQGIDISAYDGILIAMKDDIPLTEESRIWETTTPVCRSDGCVDETTADWYIKRVAKTLNYAVYLLKAVPK